MEIKEAIVYFAIGFVIGVVVMVLFRLKMATVGWLRIDRKGSERDIYRLEIENLEILEKKKRIILKIDHNADLSQK